MRPNLSFDVRRVLLKFCSLMKPLTLFSFGLLLIVGTAFPQWRSATAPLPQPKPHLTRAPVRPDLAAPALTGQLIGFVLTPVVAPLTGIVIETYFYEGQFVHKGQLLAKLWLRAQNELEYVSAPQDGIVTHADVHIRELWPAAKPLLSLANPTRLHVRLMPSHHASAPHVHTHDSLHIRLATGSAGAVSGKVVQLDSPDKAPTTLTLQLARPIAGAVVGSALVMTPATVPAPRFTNKLATRL